MIKAIIIEDEKKSRDALRGLLERYCKDVDVIAEADGKATGLQAIKSLKPELVFLDIQMPDGSGFKLLEELDTIDFALIFVTAYDQYAIKAIKFSAMDYLLKPIIPQDLINAIAKVQQHKMTSEFNENIQILLDNIRHSSGKAHKIVLSTAEKIHIVKVDDIIRCQSDNYYTLFYFVDGSTLLVSKTLKEHEDLLSEHHFIRPHKSHLINIKYIKSFSRQDGGYIHMEDGSIIPVSRRKKEKIIDIISNL